jgi:alkaline phosphatase D
VRPLSRRHLLAGGLALLVAGCSSTEHGESTTTSSTSSTTSSTSTSTSTSTTTTTTTAPAPAPAPVDFTDPFTLGVASGDPDETSVVLWTRLAPDPTQPSGAMPAADVTVRWEVSVDEAFRNVVAAGQTTASPADAHSVHVAVELADDADHWYRFRVGQHTSPVGRTRRAPATAAAATFASASCQSYEAGFYAAHRDLAAQRPDFVVWLGDYIYEAASDPTSVRPHGLPEATELDGYRLRYARYQTDADLQAAHRACPWFIVWDDHEVQDNYAGVVPKDGAPGFPARRAAAYRAWWEHMPVRLPPPTQLTADPTAEYRIYRNARWGGLLGMALLDGRQYRSDQACGGRRLSLTPPCAEMADPQRTMLGAAQEQWLATTFATWGTTWNVLGNQTVLTDMRVGGAVLNADQWDGYPAARDRLLSGLAGTPNVVVLTGDIHATIVGQLGETGVELVGTSISTTSFLTRSYEPILKLLPDVVDAELGHRGYFLHRVTAGEWRAELRLVGDATRPDSTVTAHTTYAIESGQNTVRRL